MKKAWKGRSIQETELVDFLNKLGLKPDEFKIIPHRGSEHYLLYYDYVDLPDAPGEPGEGDAIEER